MRNAAAGLKPYEWEPVVQRLRAPTGRGGCAWDVLMAAAQRGDASAYHRLLSEVAMWLRRYYARRLPPAMIDDTIQDAMIAVHKKRQTYDLSRPFGAWLAAARAFSTRVHESLDPASKCASSAPSAGPPGALRPGSTPPPSLGEGRGASHSVFDDRSR